MKNEVDSDNFSTSFLIFADFDDSDIQADAASIYMSLFTFHCFVGICAIPLSRILKNVTGIFCETQFLHATIIFENIITSHSKSVNILNKEIL